MKKKLLILALALSSAVWAGDFEDGEAAYDAGNYAEAFTKFKKASAQGNAKASEALATTMYYTGNGVEKNDIESLHWWTKAAEQGSDRAQYYVGMYYYSTVSVKRNGAEAAKWLKKVDGKDRAWAQFMLSTIYYLGQDVKIDEAEGLKHLKESAEQGHAVAQHLLGKMYAVGRGGVEQNNTKALVWIAKAAQQGHVEAQEMIDEIAKRTNQ